MEPIYGVVNGNNQWTTDSNGKILAFETKRVAMAQAIHYNQEMGGGPYVAKMIGENGFPLEENELVDKKVRVK